LRGNAAELGTRGLDRDAATEARDCMERLGPPLRRCNRAHEGLVHPRLGVFRKREPARHDADDLAGKASLDIDRATDDVGRATERSLPQPVADDNLSDIAGRRVLLRFGPECATEDRGDAQQREQRRRCTGRLHDLEPIA
jgi:hypothetical protein